MFAIMIWFFSVILVNSFQSLITTRNILAVKIITYSTSLQSYINQQFHNVHYICHIKISPGPGDTDPIRVIVAWVFRMNGHEPFEILGYFVALTNT
jgi:hypothetical protein